MQDILEMGLLLDGETGDFKPQFQHKLGMQPVYCIDFDS